MLAALLGLLAILSHAGMILSGIRGDMLAWFGASWFVPVIAMIALSTALLWTKAPRPRGIDLVAGVVAVLSLVGLFGLAAQAGGSVGAAVDSALIGLVTPIGAWALLLGGLVIGLIVTIHFSPGALIVSAVTALRAARAESARLRDLVAAPSAERPKEVKQPPATSDLLTRSAASFATAPASREARFWDVDEPEEKEEEPARDWRLMIGLIAVAYITVQVFVLATNGTTYDKNTHVLRGVALSQAAMPDDKISFQYRPDDVNANGNVQTAGGSLFTTFLLPFEITSLLLLVAAIGAVYLTRRPPADR